MGSSYTRMFILISFVYTIFCFLCIAKCLDVIPSKPEVVFKNEHIFKYLKIDIRRYGRHTPYLVNIYAEILYGFGDNTTFSFETFENIQGHFVPTLFKMEHELCKFFKEPFIGKMIVDQLPKNLTTCPIPPGYYVLPKVQVHLENLPLRIPFTYGAVDIRARVDIKGHMTDTKEPLFHIAFHGRLIQKPK